MNRRSSIATKVLAGAGAALLLLAPAAGATEAAPAEAAPCLNGMPPPAGIDQWCVHVMDGQFIVGFSSNRYGSPGNEDSWYTGICYRPSPEFFGVCGISPG